MTPEQIDSKFADHDRWFAEIRTAIQQTTDLANSNARVIQSLCNLAAEDRVERAAIINEIAEMQSEIRGLQTENKRTLDILLNQQQNEE